MSIADVLALLIGLGLIASIAWFFWGPRVGGARLALSSSGYQEAMVLVKGGYTPDVLVVQHGKPVRLTFRREETAACSEMVVFGDFNKSAKLPTGQDVRVEFLPERPGEYEFSCQMGMLRGKLIVE
jgi:plastocyanin domain-containing protein